MNFLFDANLPPALALAISHLSSAEPGIGRVCHLTEIFKPATPDVEWIEGLTVHGKDWYIVSQDKFRKSRGAEREAVRRAGHGVYVLDPSWCSQPFWTKSANLVLWWPKVLQHAGLNKGGVHRIPWRYSATRKLESI